MSKKQFLQEAFLAWFTSKKQFLQITQNIVVLLNKRMALRPLQVTEQTVRIKEKCCFNIIAYGQIEP